jgi:hypothetical protein
MGMTGISKSWYRSRARTSTSGCMPSSSARYLWLDATYLKMREGGRMVSVAAIIAVAVDRDGKREIGGLHIGPSEAQPFWTSFLRDLVRRGRDPPGLHPATAAMPSRAACRRPAPRQMAQARHLHGRRRGRRVGLHGFPPRRTARNFRRSHLFGPVKIPLDIF